VDARSLAHPAHPSTEERPCACYDGLVFIGHLVEEDGEEVAVVEAVPCCRCAADARSPRFNYSGPSLKMCRLADAPVRLGAYAAVVG
jgi:hypothetical protein